MLCCRVIEWVEKIHLYNYDHMPQIALQHFFMISDAAQLRGRIC